MQTNKIHRSSNGTIDIENYRQETLALQPGTEFFKRMGSAQSPPIRVRAIFPIYAKNTAALARAACRHAPKKIYNGKMC